MPAPRIPVPGEVQTVQHGGQRLDRKAVAGAVSMGGGASLHGGGEPIVVDIRPHNYMQ